MYMYIHTHLYKRYRERDILLAKYKFTYVHDCLGDFSQSIVYVLMAVAGGAIPSNQLNL